MTDPSAPLPRRAARTCAGVSTCWLSRARRRSSACRPALALSLPDLRVLASVPVGREPYHIAATASGILFVANHASNTVTIIDGARRVRLGTLRVPPGPHGLGVLTHGPDQR